MSNLDPGDIPALARALAKFGVEYVVIGGAAMALHGFPRMTRDIDLLLPVDAENNSRLMQALASLPKLRDDLASLDKAWLDNGYSTAVNGVMNVDLLFVAADRSFNDLRKHIIVVEFEGVQIITLDVDGMLLTKKTSRKSDVSDRLKLERLRAALRKVRRDEIAAGGKSKFSEPARPRKK